MSAPTGYRAPTTLLLDSPITCVQDGTNAQLVEVARRLYPLDGRVLDLTHGSKGGFWRVFHPVDLTALHPGAGIDFRCTPFGDGEFDHVVFDPPYVAKGGHETSTIDEMNDRFGMLHVEKDPATQWELQIVPGLVEAARVCRPKERVGRKVVPGGLVWFKCMDYVTGGKVHWFSKLALDVFDRAGLDLVDEFILNGRPGPQPKTNPDGSPRRQVHARRAHSVLMIGRRRAATAGRLL
jgi:hypothetical protein